MFYSLCRHFRDVAVMVEMPSAHFVFFNSRYGFKPYFVLVNSITVDNACVGFSNLYQTMSASSHREHVVRVCRKAHINCTILHYIFLCDNLIRNISFCHIFS